MAEKNSIDLCGGYRLVAHDDRNWRLEHFHVAASNNGKGDPEPKWHRTGQYFQRLGPALAYVLERRMRDEGEPDESLRDAMERVGVIRDELMAAVA